MPMTLIVISILVAVGFFSYIFLMIFYPEWVGITGKAAKQNLKDHKEGSEGKETEFFSDMSPKN